jgi:anti-sigma factor RsiW
MAEAQDLEVHLATCPACARELARYREVMEAVGTLYGSLEPVPPDLVERVLAHVASPVDLWRSRVSGLAHDRRIHVAAASLGGAVVGAAAMALVWSRLAKRAVAGVGNGLPA